MFRVERSASKESVKNRLAGPVRLASETTSVLLGESPSGLSVRANVRLYRAPGTVGKVCGGE
jgi:hypothetical protein